MTDRIPISTIKQLVVFALYQLQSSADFEDQVAFLNSVGVEPYQSASIRTEPDERAMLFEDVIQQCIGWVDGQHD